MRQQQKARALAAGPACRAAGRRRVWTDLRVKELHRSGKEFELMERAMGFAALAMLTVFPLLIVVAAAGAATHHGVAVWVVYGMGLTGSSARAVVSSFPRPPGSWARRVFSACCCWPSSG